MRSMWIREAAMHCVNARARRRANETAAATSMPWGSAAALYPSGPGATRPSPTLPVVSRRVLEFEAINKLAGHRFSQPICSPANRPGLTEIDEKLHFTALSWTCKRETRRRRPPGVQRANPCCHADHIAGVRDDARPGGAAAAPTSPNCEESQNRHGQRLLQGARRRERARV